MKQANLIKKLIKEALKTPPKQKCNCGCNTCSNVGSNGPIINEKLDAEIKVSPNFKYHIDNKSPLHETKLKYGSKEYLNLWAEARYLYSREAIFVCDEDKKIITSTNLGEYGLYENKKVPLDLLLETELGTDLDVAITGDNIMLPYEDLLAQIEKDWGKEDLYYEVEQAIFDKDQKQLINILKNWDVYNDYSYLLGLNEFFIYKRNPLTKKIVKENQPAPAKPKTEPGITEPGTKEPTKPKRRTLTPPTEAPDTKPKAKVNESEKELINKIAARFKHLQK